METVRQQRKMYAAHTHPYKYHFHQTARNYYNGKTNNQINKMEKKTFSFPYRYVDVVILHFSFPSFFLLYNMSDHKWNIAARFFLFLEFPFWRKYFNNNQSFRLYVRNSRKAPNLYTTSPHYIGKQRLSKLITIINYNVFSYLCKAPTVCTTLHLPMHSSDCTHIAWYIPLDHI